jgi:hypothetical protein
MHIVLRSKVEDKVMTNYRRVFIIHHHNHRTTAQAVSRLLPTVVARVRSQVRAGFVVDTVALGQFF